MVKINIVPCLLSLCACLRLPSEKKLIFDLGMNTGVDTENFLNRGFKVVAVEANPVMAKKEAKREIASKAIKKGDLKILTMGIKNDRESSKKGLEFWIPDPPNATTSTNFSLLVSGGASFAKYSACRTTGNCHAIIIPTKTCSDLLEEEGIPHYLKVDIEGQDIECLKNIMEQRCGPDKLPQYVSFENYGLDTFAEYYGEGGKAKELMELMHKRGYTGWKRARTWLTEYTNSASSGTSSAFGEELLDLETSNVWKPTSDFKDKLGCDVDCDMKGFCKGWCDMHAKLDASLATC